MIPLYIRYRRSVSPHLITSASDFRDYCQEVLPSVFSTLPPSDVKLEAALALRLSQNRPYRNFQLATTKEAFKNMSFSKPPSRPILNPSIWHLTDLSTNPPTVMQTTTPDLSNLVLYLTKGQTYIADNPPLSKHITYGVSDDPPLVLSHKPLKTHGPPPIKHPCPAARYPLSNGNRLYLLDNTYLVGAYTASALPHKTRTLLSTSPPPLPPLPPHRIMVINVGEDITFQPMDKLDPRQFIDYLEQHYPVQAELAPIEVPVPDTDHYHDWRLDQISLAARYVSLILGRYLIVPLDSTYPAFTENRVKRALALATANATPPNLTAPLDAQISNLTKTPPSLFVNNRTELPKWTLIY